MVDEPKFFTENKSPLIPAAGEWNTGPDRWGMLFNSGLYPSEIALHIFQAALFYCVKENSFLLF